MKISEVTLQDVKDYCKIEYSDDDVIINSILIASKSYIKNYTGLTDETVDLKEDLTIALLVLCNDMFENREFIVQKDKINLVVKSILDMHSTNYL
jgi:uncharacterized phage protein (predicted DNA packaging)